MKSFIIFNIDGRILRTGGCADSDFELQAGKDEFIMEGTANDVTQKIINGKIVDKSSAEIEAEKPSEPEPIPFEQKQANITNEQYQILLDRLTALEE